MALTMSRRAWLILSAPPALGLLVAGILAFTLPKYYTAEVKLVVVDQSQASLLTRLEGLSSFIPQLGLGTLSGQSNRSEAIALLKSHFLIDQFISTHQLLPVLFEEDWDSKSGRWKEEDQEDWPTSWDGYKKFVEDVLAVREDFRSGLVTVEIEWRDAQLAAEWANGLVELGNKLFRERVRQEAQLTTEFINRELERISDLEIRQSLFELLLRELSRIVVANVREDYVYRVVDPAVVRDADDFSRPKRPLLLLAGLMFGLLVSAAIYLFRFRSDVSSSGIANSESKVIDAFR